MNKSSKMTYVFAYCLFILICIELTNQYKTDISSLDPVENYCSSFSSCRDCKSASLQCDWCHEVGCTHYSSLHCPQKIFLDKTYFKENKERFCNEIISDNPIFIPANLRRFIKMNLKIDDLTIYKRSIMCEIHVEETIIRVKATISNGALYCDMTILRINQSVSLGYIRLLWGGVDPYSNLILIIVYRCEYMASDCVDCQVLDKGFNCGWCQEKSVCSLLEECPRQYGQWINKKSLCGKYNIQVPHQKTGNFRTQLRDVKTP